MIALARKAAKRVWLRVVAGADLRRRERLGLLDRGLPPELWDASVNASGHLVIGGCDTVELAERFGTPLFVVNASRLRRDYQGFVESFRRHLPSAEVSYSYKTNPIPGVLRFLHGLGAGAEVISHFELWLALELGVPPDRIVFNGPAKSEDGLALAVSRGVRLINIDHLGEIDAVERLAGDAGRRQQVGVRVVTSVGWSSQFGLSLRQGAAREAFQRASRCRNLDPCGLHVHLGTGIKDMGVYLQAIREVLEFSNELRDRLGVAIRFFDFGGGFGVPTVRPYSAADMRLIANGYPPRAIEVDATPRIESYGSRIADLFLKYRPPTGHEDPIVIFEPGRSVTSAAQTLLLRAIAIKPRPDLGRNVILDGGKNVAMPPGWEFHEVFAASRMDQAHGELHDLFGPLCHPGDVVCANKRLPPLAPGDVVAVMDTGAYFVPNQMNFSNPRCGAVLVENGEARMIRNHESFEEVVQRDFLAESAP